MKILDCLKRCARFIFRGVPVYKIYPNIVEIRYDSLMSGEKILLLGGTRGIGYAMAKKFVDCGADVVITGRDEKQLKEKAQILGCKYYVQDISLPNSVDILNQIISKFGHITSLVINAGISLHESFFFDVTPETFDSQINTNLRGPYFMAQAYINYLVNRKLGGGIANFLGNRRNI